MNPRIFVGAAVAAFAIILVIVGTGQLASDSPQGAPDAPPSLEPLLVNLESITITEMNPKAAIIDVRFDVKNPNERSVILQFLKYAVYESDLRIHAGQIGSRPNAFVTESNYFTVLAGQSTILSDRITLKNTGNTPELWEALARNPVWHITGEAYFNLSSITSGGENIVKFEFRP